MFNDFDNHWKFWQVEPWVTFPNYKYVHPGKQCDVQVIYDALVKQENVKLLVIFGSAVTIGCFQWSDIDIYIETDNGYHYELPWKELRYDVDVLVNIDSWTWGVGKEIAEKGIVIFDRR